MAYPEAGTFGRVEKCPQQPERVQSVVGVFGEIDLFDPSSAFPESGL